MVSRKTRKPATGVALLGIALTLSLPAAAGVEEPVASARSEARLARGTSVLTGTLVKEDELAGQPAAAAVETSLPSYVRTGALQMLEAVLANGLSLGGAMAYQVNEGAGTCSMQVGSVTNSRTSGTSGALQLRLVATVSKPVAGSGLSGFTLDTYALGTLAFGHSLTSINTGTRTLTDPPAGTYWMTVALVENTGSALAIQDLATFPTQSTFAGGVGGGDYGSIILDGPVTYTITSPTAVLTAAKITNTWAGSISGSLRLALWATTTKPVLGQAVNATMLAKYDMPGQLMGNSSWTNVTSGSVPFTAPPDGTYYMSLALLEYNGSAGWAYDDFYTFPDQRTFGSGGGGGGGGTPSDTLSLLGGKITVTITYRNQYDGTSGPAHPIPQADQYGFFYYTDRLNPEVFVKALDFGASRPYLLFYGGLTDLEYTVTFKNTVTGKTAVFFKPAGSYDGGGDTTSLPH